MILQKNKHLFREMLCMKTDCLVVSGASACPLLGNCCVRRIVRELLCKMDC